MCTTTLFPPANSVLTEPFIVLNRRSIRLLLFKTHTTPHTPWLIVEIFELPYVTNRVLILRYPKSPDNDIHAAQDIIVLSRSQASSSKADMYHLL